MFYGVVKSYDSEHKKYVVLYDDGDVEVLRLDKERWELVDNGHKPTKVEELARLSLIQLLSILMWMMGGRSKVEENNSVETNFGDRTVKRNQDEEDDIHDQEDSKPMDERAFWRKTIVQTLKKNKNKKK
ncbi:unnamed protein product [Camellia sinensis]